MLSSVGLSELTAFASLYFAGRSAIGACVAFRDIAYGFAGPAAGPIAVGSAAQRSTYSALSAQPLVRCWWSRPAAPKPHPD
jgi:hypothetical protein